MRKTSAIIVMAVMCCVLVATGQAQQKTVNFRELQKFLPTADVPGFTKGKPGGQTSSAMGMSTSEATLDYAKGGDRIGVSIQDMAGIPFASMGVSMMGAADFDKQTENGYEKSIKIGGFAGTEKVDNGQYKSAEINLFVANRFMVKVTGHGISDVALLKTLIESINLSELAKLAQ
jgi:hypothetical protein